MRRLRICIYGGTDLHGTPTEFIAELAYQILDSMPALIVTGGFLHSNKKPMAISTDVAALRGAQRYAAEHARDLKDCFEAWIPEPSLDNRQDVGGAVRMSASDGIAVRVMTGRTALGRRLAMVRDVDLVVTISGRVHTEVVVEHALELGLPVLPIPDAGGDSAELLRQHKKEIAASFDAGALDGCLKEVSKALATEPTDHRRAAGAVIDLLLTAKVGRCLVLMPYDRAHDRLYETTVRPAVERHMTAIRLDQNASSASIYTSFASAIEASSALIADVTTAERERDVRSGIRARPGTGASAVHAKAGAPRGPADLLRDPQHPAGIPGHAGGAPDRGLPSHDEGDARSDPAFRLTAREGRRSAA